MQFYFSLVYPLNVLRAGDMRLLGKTVDPLNKDVGMARFDFNLQGVLKQREHVEQLAQREVAQAQQMMSQLQDRLRRLDEGVRAVADDMRSNYLHGVLDVTIMASHRRYVVAMERSAMELARLIADAQAKVEQAQRQLLNAARERKTIEKLKDKQFERWITDQYKREAADLDEAGTQIAFQNLTEDPGRSSAN
jgi:flagellar protein FliJ